MEKAEARVSDPSSSCGVSLNRALQKGYDVAILSPGQQEPSAEARPTSTADGGFPPSQLPKSAVASPYHEFSGPPKTKPLWRTTKGRVLIALIALVVIGAALGGGLGGGLHHKSNTSQPASGGSDGSGSADGSDTNQGTSPQSASGVSGQEQGPASPTPTRRP